MTEDQRHRAVQRIRAKRAFWTHFATYLAVNALLVVIWAVTSPGYFWPIWPILGWGIGVGANAVGVFLRPQEISEERIEREMQGRSGS